MATTTLLEFFNSNMHRNYPLADSASGMDINGTQLPYNFLCGASIDVLPTAASQVEDNHIYLSSVVKTSSGYRITLMYQPDGGASAFVFMYGDAPSTISECGTAVSLTAATADIPDSLAALRESEGTLYIGSLSGIENIANIQLTYTTGKLASSVVRVGPAGIRHLNVVDENGIEHNLSGVVTLEAGDNTALSVSGNTVTISSLSVSADEETAISNLVTRVVKRLGGPPVTTLNGMSGAVTMVGADCTDVAVSEADARITISNPCATPCCAEQSPSDITDALTSLRDAKERLLNYFGSMSMVINTLQARLSSILSAKGY